VVFTALPILRAYPVLALLVHATTFAHMLEAELWLSFMYASYNGSTVVALTEIMPADVHTVGFSLAYLMTVILSGFTPIV